MQGFRLIRTCGPGTPGVRGRPPGAPWSASTKQAKIKIKSDLLNRRRRHFPFPVLYHRILQRDIQYCLAVWQTFW